MIDLISALPMPLILGAVGIILLIYRYRGKLAYVKRESNIRMTLAFVMIISEMSYF